MLDEMHPIFGGSSVFDPHRSPAGERLGCQKQILGPVALVLIILTSNRARLGRARLLDLLGQLNRMLVKTDDRLFWIIWFAVERKDIFHVVNEFGILVRRNHPLLGSMRL